MENLKNEENAVKKIYGEENLKDILTDLLEKTFIQEIKKANYKVYGTKVDGGINVKDTTITKKYALVIGNEGNGMTEIVGNLCDEYLYIKMNKEVESLNAGVATSILLYEMDDKYDTN